MLNNARQGAVFNTAVYGKLPKILDRSNSNFYTYYHMYQTSYMYDEVWCNSFELQAKQDYLTHNYNRTVLVIAIF